MIEGLGRDARERFRQTGGFVVDRHDKTEADALRIDASNEGVFGARLYVNAHAWTDYPASPVCSPRDERAAAEEQVTA
jgi:hypothetical protein